MTQGQSSGRPRPLTLPKWARDALHKRNQPALFDLEPPTPISQPPPPAPAAPELECPPTVHPNHLNAGKPPVFFRKDNP